MTQSLRYLSAFFVGAAFVATAAFGQADFGADAFSGGPSIGVGGGADFRPIVRSGSAGAAFGATGTIELSAGYRLAPDERSGILTVSAQVPPGHHIYSLTQPKGATGMKSQLTLLSTDVVTLDARGFVAMQSPTPKSVDPGKPAAEEHFGQVDWSVPFRIAEGVDPKTLSIGVRYDGQICSEIDERGLGGSCVPVDDKRTTATFQGMLTKEPQYVALQAPAAQGEVEAPGRTGDAAEDVVKTAAPYKAKNSSASIEISISPRVVAPGEQVTLTVAANSKEPWHIYAYAPIDPKRTGPKPTLIVLSDPQPWMTGEPTASVEPIEIKSKSPKLPDYYVHDQVQWTWTWTVPKDAPAGAVTVAGLVGYQTCRDETCQPPIGIKFSGEIVIGDAAGGSSEISIEESKYSDVAKAAEVQHQGRGDASAATLDLHDIKPAAGSSLLVALGWALAGGFLLNFMPCVLPVLGLKVYSFIEMAGESRSKVFWHNVAYILGLLVVFWAMGTVAVMFRTVSLFAGNVPLTLAMIGVVFAMALSFLGLWEIPIPGFAGASPLNKLAEKENLSGAFFKGVIATILATPCGAPLMSLAFTQIFGRHPIEVYLIFTFVGIGMAAPYFVIALNPQIVARILPRPGAWMIVFKQALAFLLLGTVAWLVSTIHFTYALPTMVFVFGIWLACWLVGVGQHHFYTGARMAACWSAAAIVVAFTVLLSFADYGVLGVMNARYGDRPAETADGWEPYTFAKLQSLTEQDKTVVVDFTADWCPNCKVLEHTVLNTDAFRDKVNSHGAATLVADYTERPQEMKALLERLTGADLLPVLAIFPAGRPEQPIVFTGGYTTAMLLAELDKANAPAGSGEAQTVARAETTDPSR